MSAQRRMPDYKLVMREVNKLRQRFGAYSPPVNPVDIAKSSGINVIFVEFDGKFQNISGFYDPEDNAIYVNKDEYPLRQTFTIAHELGHALLHKEWASGSDYKVLLRHDNIDKGEPHEREANAFAAHLLVPRDMLDDVYEQLSVEDLSRLFSVSVPVIKNRLSFEYGI